MGMQQQNMRVCGFRRRIFFHHLCGKPCGDQPVRIPEGKIKAFQQREPAAGVGEATHAQIGNAGDDAFIYLWRLSQGASSVYRDFDTAIRAFFYLPCPALSLLTLHMGRGKKDTVRKFNDLRRGGGCFSSGFIHRLGRRFRGRGWRFFSGLGYFRSGCRRRGCGLAAGR
ncbi:MAG: hypothetical protein BWX80_04166 [Candidatus Hydrogenedentes bacterium ADurb.Bin101]|nr:MAG: hypothetical protein BWX80_04166 [Candidatus Hydrogenedentes bacterium ADurb.Bin101]